MGGVVSFIFGGGGSSTTKTYQRLGELQKQTAEEGNPRPMIWGRVRPISGNVIHAGPVDRKMVEVGRTTTSGGKGGGGSQTTVQYAEKAFRSYAIRICEGPISAVIRVWKNDKLVYDARGTEWGEKNNPAFLEFCKFYLGGWEQMPDPVLEAIWGAGKVPAYRGTAYLRVEYEDVTDFGGRVPVFTFEVQRGGIVTTLTSKPYPLTPLVDRAATTNGAVTAGELNQEFFPPEPPPPPIEQDAPIESAQDAGGAVTAGNLRELLQSVSYVESVDSSGAVTAGSLRGLLQSVGYAESANGSGAVAAGELDKLRINYDRWVAESVDGSGAVTGGTHG